MTGSEVRMAGAGGIGLVGTVWRPAGDPLGTVLLLHGGGQTRHSWRRSGVGIARHGWTAMALDMRGHGDSDWAADYGLDALVADLRAVTGRLGVSPVLVGASLGGRTALVAEGEHPGLARGLVLVDVTPRVERDGVEAIMGFLRSGLSGFASLDEAADAVSAFDPSRPRPRSTDGLRKNVRLRDGRWYWHWDPRFVEDGTGDRPGAANPRRSELAARAVTVPTMLVRGAASQVVSVEVAEELRGLIPHAEQIDVARAGHMVAGDDNDVFATGLYAFLDRLSPNP